MRARSRASTAFERLHREVRLIDVEVTGGSSEIFNQSDIALLRAVQSRATLSRLQSVLGFSRANLTHIIDRLAARGLMRRVHIEGKRGVELHVTAAGDELVTMFGELEDKTRTKVSEHFGIERAMLDKLIDAILGGRGSADSKSPPPKTAKKSAKGKAKKK